jgi:hypothetical protein
MASRLASLRSTLKSTTETIVRDGAKISEYRGPSVGSGTSGNYGNLPRPIPVSFFFKQEFNLKWAAALTATVVMVTATMAPFWSIPFYRKMSKQLKHADEKFGPTRYGAGKKFFM